MSKYRLEEIKDLLRLTKKENFVEDYYVLIKLFEYEHADWLIEQTERTQELEELINEVNEKDFNLVIKLQEQNKRYREWLEKIECNTSGEENLMARKALAGEDLADYDG